MLNLLSARRAICLVGLLGCLAAASVAEACPGCKEALASNAGGEGGDLVSGVYYSILFMMSMPFIIVGSFAGGMYLSVRRARARQAAAPAEPAPHNTT